MDRFYKKVKLEAFSNYLSKTHEFFYRSVCRWYSTTFHTPLQEVFNLHWPDILMHYYEHNFDSMNENQLREFVKQDLNYDPISKDLLEQLEKEQASIANKKKKKANKNNAISKETKQEDTATQDVVVMEHKFD